MRKVLLALSASSALLCLVASGVLYRLIKPPGNSFPLNVVGLRRVV